MQFFIINKDPLVNAETLPEYAITKVNCREGIQILSDIGHNMRITWEGQNKAYSIWHAETRRFMVNRKEFRNFVNHLRACLIQYAAIKGKKCSYWSKFVNAADGIVEIINALPENRSHEEFMLDYLIRGKSEKMKPEDLQKLKETR